ncbi:unannotated protein [freshwater metagenome]|uniref:Unannotated protein n=1 Tax=freshwater metagenome TaxID=449393 RepID=A0A6J7GBM3_9ZZZZ
MDSRAAHGDHRAGGDPAGWPTDLHAAADWLTEDVVQRLCAMRQDLAETAPLDAQQHEALTAVRARVLSIIDDLRDLGTTLRSGPLAGSAEQIDALTSRVADHCEGARALMAQSMQLTVHHGRLAAESVRLGRDAVALRAAAAPRDAPRRSSTRSTALRRSACTDARWRRTGNRASSPLPSRHRTSGVAG